MEVNSEFNIDGAGEMLFVVPQKLVKSPMEIPIWEKSEAYYEIIGFINAVSMSVQGKKLRDEFEISPIPEKLLNLFTKLNELVDKTPPAIQPQRFGNKAYRDWFQKMKDQSVDLMQATLPESHYRAIPELVCYLIESFGNPTRIDYGTGHELSFIMFLCSLFKIGLLKENDQVAIGLKVFDSYLIFVRRLQQVYRMEPAGSHGVWSLDDFQFIPFIWGSAQFAVKAPIEPEQFPDENVAERFKDDYMFISCIDYIHKVKIGLFAEHSCQLWSVSAVKSWSKINTGLVKMYQKEVLSKFPIIQHVLFGSLLTLKPVKPGTMLPNARLGQTTMPPPSLGSSISLKSPQHGIGDSSNITQ